MKHFAVIGAGITGITTAWVLRQRGYDVTVFDRHRYPAMETSFANGGQLSASNAEVWTNINTILKGLKWLFKSDAPLSMNLRPSWHKYSWLASFASQCGNYEKNTVATAKLAIESRRYMAEFAHAAGVEFDREDSGILHIYKKEADFAHAHKVTDMLAKAGLLRRQLTPEEVYEIEPALQARVIGGYFTDSDFTGDIHKFTNGLAEAARHAGVQFAMNTEITDIHHEGEGPHLFWKELDGEEKDQSFDGVVITAGVMSRKLASALGDRVNVYPVKGYSITVDLKDAASQAAAPTVSLLDDAAKIVTA
ncbi:MAG: FAD-dependent oxidoreductase, partial [Proteobacteria bacterium]|nr:FAD-dependent oxidoreductase [Pseudomonadota bacterium]